MPKDELDSKLDCMMEEISKQHTLFYINTILNMLIFCFVLGIMLRFIIG